MKLIVALVLTFSVLSCSTTGIKVEKAFYKSSKSSPSLEIPPDLTGLDDSNNKNLPGSMVGTEEAIGRYKESGVLLDRVLPKIEGITLQGHGDFYWLEVDQDAAKVYESIAIFWAEEGFVLETDEPLIGIMKTEWLENKAGYLFADNSFLGDFFAGFYDSDQKDQYRTRIARNDSNMKTNVYLTQYGQEFMLVDDELADDKTKGWQSSPNNPELEVEMLSRMMLFLGMQNSQVKEQLAKIGQFPKRARLVKDDDGVITLVLKESLDRGWNRVINQLDRLNVEYISKNKNKQLISIKQKLTTKTQDKGFFASLFGNNDDASDSDKITLNIAFGESGSSTTLINMETSFGAKDGSEQANELLQFLFKSLK